MISNQVIQMTMEELHSITKIDLCVLETDGSTAASTFEPENISQEMVRIFAQSPAEGQSLQGCHFSRYMMRGRLHTYCWRRAAAKMPT